MTKASANKAGDNYMAIEVKGVVLTRGCGTVRMTDAVLEGIMSVTTETVVGERNSLEEDRGDRNEREDVLRHTALARRGVVRRPTGVRWTAERGRSVNLTFDGHIVDRSIPILCYRYGPSWITLQRS